MFSRLHRVVPILLALGSAACSGAAPPSPAPEPVAEPEIAAAPAEPEMSLRERREQPFAVVSRGRPAERAPRALVVRPGSDPEALPESPATAVLPADSAVRAAASTTEPAVPAPAPAPSKPERQASTRTRRPTTHQVAAGETFYGIALRYELTFSALAAANPTAEPDRLRVGQELRVPAATPTTASRPTSQGRKHEVARGETLFGIARRYGVPPQRIRDVNRLESDNIRIGQVLVIPGSS